MEIRTMKIGALKKAPYNPRIELQPGDEEYEAIKKSIKQFGIVQPIIWNERTNNVVSGHQRLNVLLDMGIEEVDVSVVNLPEYREKQLNVALNKISGDWDNESLSFILQELKEDAFETGFTREEVEMLTEEVGTYFDEPDVRDEELEQPYLLTIELDKAYQKDIKSYIKKNTERPIVDHIVEMLEGWARRNDS